MKFKSITSVSFTISLITFITCFFTSLILQDSYSTILIISIVVPVITYLFSYLFISKYVIWRIKPIYQTMLEKNIKSKTVAQEIKDDDIIESVSKGLGEWATNKSNEIERLKHLETYRKEFLGNVSHELKTPLFTIQGYILTIMDDEFKDKNIAMKFLTNADKGVQRMINIVNDLEDISLLEIDIMRLNRAKFDIVKLTKDIFERINNNAKKKNITLTCNSVNSVFIYADMLRIEQVLINLISNSIKYGRQNGNVRIDFIDGFTKVMIEVTDDGIGIAKDDIPRLFERFFRVDKSRSHNNGGTGLGLSIVKHIIDAHSETITTRSELGKYTTFSFSLNKYLS